MNIGWGWKIAIGYGGFATMIIALVVASGRQKVDLVSADYYKDEIAYQQVIDASTNQAKLGGDITIRANREAVTIDFPPEFAAKDITGQVRFYSAVNKDDDRDFKVGTGNTQFAVRRTDLRPVVYTLKLTYAVDGRNYYYEARLDLRNI